jgi:hypothetical protein
VIYLVYYTSALFNPPISVRSDAETLEIKDRRRYKFSEGAAPES